MMNGQVFDAKEIDEIREFVRQCCEGLLANRSGPSDDLALFKYPDDCSKEHWPIRDIGETYKCFRKEHLGKGNVYAIWTGESGNVESWSPRYVGQRKSGALGARIRAHLVNKGKKTGSQLKNVKESVSCGLEIAVSFIMVEPETLRCYVEEEIINSERNASAQRLDWNKHL